MKEMDNMITQLFQDKPIAQESLWSMHEGIMDQVLSNPVNFQEKLLLAQRRKWGYILLGIILSFGMGLFFVAWFAADRIQSGLVQLSTWIITNIPSFEVFVEGWRWLAEKWILLSNVKMGIEIFWQQYAYSIMGIILAWVVFESMRGKVLFREEQ